MKFSLSKNEFAGPDGGNGGTGGHVIFKATRHRKSLSHLKKVLEAPNGVNGGTCDMEGKNAAHKIIDVPMGTLFRNLDREIVAEVDKEGSMFLAARGGEGGKGNAFFKSSDQQKPLIAEKGGQGEAFTFDIGKNTYQYIIHTYQLSGCRVIQPYSQSSYEHNFIA